MFIEEAGDKIVPVFRRYPRAKCWESTGDLGGSSAGWLLPSRFDAPPCGTGSAAHIFVVHLMHKMNKCRVRSKKLILSGDA